MNGFPSKSFFNNRKSAIQIPKLVGAFAIALTLALGGAVTQAQQPGKIPRVGYLTGTREPTQAAPDANRDAFRQGLRDLGYLEGKSILIEYRYAEGKLDRVPRLVAELVKLKVDVMVAIPQSAIRTAKQEAPTIPIVMVTTVDPIETGFVDSLARPGGSVTGLTRLSRELSGKRLELIKEMIPATSRVGVLWDASSTGLKEYELPARGLKIQLQSLEVRSPSPNLEGALQTATKERANALLIVRNALLIDNRKRIAEIAIQNRMPSISEGSVFAEAGILASYSSDENDSFRRAALYVDKILKGAKPADLPVEQPTKFEFVINLKTAKQIGLTIPPNVLARADRVIR
jgi:putative ABC transport system substrate-binding protein